MAENLIEWYLPSILADSCNSFFSANTILMYGSTSSYLTLTPIFGLQVQYFIFIYVSNQTADYFLAVDTA